MVNNFLLSLSPSQWADYDGIEQIPRTRSSGVTFYDVFTFFINGMKEILSILKNVFILDFGAVRFNLLYFLVGAMILTLFLSIVFRFPSGTVETTLQTRQSNIEKEKRNIEKAERSQFYNQKGNYYKQKGEYYKRVNDYYRKKGK